MYSFWSIYFSGGDSIEDLSINLKDHFRDNRLFNIPSPDRVLNRFKELSQPKELVTSKRSKSNHEFSINLPMNELNIRLLKRLGLKSKGNHVLDYDNTIIFTNKKDSARTYKKIKDIILE